ncbi:hypothetical protein CDAR_485941 [Caerostris darwini]|uniref:Uncharacterized protein n=1 Tax=Caerostris darwini TaxID=1538125 RepID=A0AAV4WK72_9ARAC|nr:hypothetical protein CDAR_485941 [Caerostris darwini]
MQDSAGEISVAPVFLGRRESDGGFREKNDAPVARRESQRPGGGDEFWGRMSNVQETRESRATSARDFYSRFRPRTKINKLLFSTK